MTQRTARSCFVCPCHDVTVADVEAAIASGHTNVETIKRATAIYMGACQGKFCAPLIQQVLIDNEIESPGEHCRPAARLPVEPVVLGALVNPEEA